MSLSIGDIAERTGVTEGTLRMWEARHGFPQPERLPSGHRRYSEQDVELVRRVASQRAGGLPLGMAIDRVMHAFEAPARSLYAALRERQPQLEPRTLTMHAMLALSHAIEDESLARAEPALLFAFFQGEHNYRRQAPRWRELARTAHLAIVFADFASLRAPSDGPVEVPIDTDEPLLREWAIVCDAARHAVCLSAWERPTRGTASSRERQFEAIWSVEPDIVRDASRVCADIVAARDPALVEHMRSSLDAPLVPAGRDQLVLATAIMNRTLSYVG